VSIIHRYMTASNIFILCGNCNGHHLSSYSKFIVRDTSIYLQHFPHNRGHTLVAKHVSEHTSCLDALNLVHAISSIDDEWFQMKQMDRWIVFFISIHIYQIFYFLDGYINHHKQLLPSKERAKPGVHNSQIHDRILTTLSAQPGTYVGGKTRVRAYVMFRRFKSSTRHIIQILTYIRVCCDVNLGNYNYNCVVSILMYLWQ
jgi:hypothetical protein